MAADIDWEQVNKLVDPAEAAMGTLTGDEEGGEPDRRHYGVYLSWTGDDGISRNVEASVDPATYELEVAYNAWSDHSIEERNAVVRLWTRRSIGRFPDPTDAIEDAIKTAYGEAEAVRDADLSRAARIAGEYDGADR